MEVHWFIFKKNYHQGPFSIQQMKKMMEEGGLTDSDLVWKEGQQNWSAVKNCPDLFQQISDEMNKSEIRSLEEDDFEGPSLSEDELLNHTPELEEVDWNFSLQELKEQSSENIVSEFAFENREDNKTPKLAERFSTLEDEEFYHEVPLSENLIQKGLEQQRDTSSELEDLRELPKLNLPPIPELEAEIQSKLGKNRSSWVNLLVKIILIFGLFGALASVAIYIGKPYLDSSTYRDYRGVKLRDQHQLASIAQIPLDKGPVVRYALTTNKKSLLGASNRSGEADILIIGESKDKQVLSEHPIKFRAQAKLKKRKIEIIDLTFTQNSEFVPGFYQIKTRGVDHSILGKILHSMQEAGFFNFLPFVRHYKKEFEFSGPYYVGDLSKRQYLKKLKAYWSGIEKRKGRPFKDLLQKVKTFRGLVEKIDIIFTRSLSIKKRKAQAFENKYAFQVAPILQKLIIDHHEKGQSEGPIDQGLREYYRELVDYGKEIGLLASEMALYMRNRPKLNYSNRASKEKMFKQRVEELLSSGNQTYLEIEKGLKL